MVCPERDLGQIRDRLIILIRDEHERIVPDVMDWQITEYDINKDIKGSHLLHFSAIKVQVKYHDHLFRIYIKSKGKETVSRVEESLNPNKPVLETNGKGPIAKSNGKGRKTDG